MKIKRLKLKNFKRFTDLQIDLGENPAKLVVLLGPNGCGKSSVFDAFENVGNRGKQGFTEDMAYLKKDQSKQHEISMETDKGNLPGELSNTQTTFYIRSAYRTETDFQINNISRKNEITVDDIRPKRLIDADVRVRDNYERLVGDTVNSLYSGQKDHLLVSGLREELIGLVRESMQKVFPDLVLEGIGNPMSEGQFFFTKGESKHFPYKNISAGEKAAFDLILDMIIKTRVFNDSVLAIDEPELHMHSALQRSLLKELYSLIPEDCQFWVATHSIGFIRGSLELFGNEPNNVSLLDFNNIDFDSKQLLAPIVPNPGKIRDIFSVAIEDLASMITPSKIIICEGSLNAPDDSAKKDFDTIVYNTIFSDEDIIFISGDSKGMAQKSANFLFEIVKKSGVVREIYSLVDRDELTAEQIKDYKEKNKSQLFLERKSIENYLLDEEVIKKYCKEKAIDFSKVSTKLSDILNGDAKNIQTAIKNQCGYQGSEEDFKKELAIYITPELDIYSELKKIIFAEGA